MTKNVNHATGEVIDLEDRQPMLVPMTDDELREAGRKLARLIRERAEMLDDLAVLRAEHRVALQALDGEIDGLASTIRTQGR